LFQGRQKRLVSQGPASLLVGTEEFYVFFPRHPGEEGSPVRGEFEQGTNPHHSVVPTAHVGGGKDFKVALVVFVTKQRLLSSVSPLGDVMGKARCDNTC